MLQHLAASRLQRSLSARRALGRRLRRVALGTLAVLLACSVSLVSAQETQRPARKLDEAPLRPRLAEGIAAVKARNPALAVEIFDEIDRKFQAAYAKGPRVYCSRGPKETVLYLTKSAAEKGGAIAIGPLWCDAIYFKAYSLVELKRPADAAKELDRALVMAPHNAQYLNERAYLLTMARDFAAAIAMFRQAEEDSALTPHPQAANEMKSRACRGIGYALIEMGKLDEAEANYGRCLTIDPGDQRSKDQLAYIARVKARRK